MFETEPKNYLVQADSGRDVHHYFCEKCGSPLGMQQVGGEVRGIRAASLDDPSWLVPMANVWTCKSHPWEEISSVLPRYETQPNDDEWGSVFKAQAEIFKSHGIV